MPVDFRFTIKDAKRTFFDKRAVRDQLKPFEIEALSSVGAYVRTVARNSIKKALGPQDHSKPGRPPKSHVGFLKKFMFSTYDQKRHSVVIGPAYLPSKGLDDWKSSSPIPATLEYGGKIVFQGVSANRGANGRFLNRNQKATPGQVAFIQERSYTRRAFSKALQADKLQKYFRFLKK